MTRRSCSSQVTDELMAVGLSLGVRRGGRSRTQRFTSLRSEWFASRGAKEECHGPVVGKPVCPVYGDVRRPSGRGQDLDVHDRRLDDARRNPPNQDRTHRIPPVTQCDEFSVFRRVADPYAPRPHRATKGVRMAPSGCGKVTDVGTALKGRATAKHGRLAQRESTAFTRQGSLVRSQYRPHEKWPPSQMRWRFSRLRAAAPTDSGHHRTPRGRN
jgi:hypothetical protein